MMEYTLEDYGLITVLFLKGNLTYKNAEELGNLLHSFARETNGDMVIDMSQVGHIDSAIAGQFIAAQRDARVQRRQFVIANVSPSVMRLMRVGLGETLIQVYQSTEEAIAELTEKARGGEPRKVIPDIQCGHSDCAFYTFTKHHGDVVPACQYAYPEEISNGPGCRCYRVNWNQHKWNIEGIAIPLKMGEQRKKSLYEIRDQYVEEELPHENERQSLDAVHPSQDQTLLELPQIDFPTQSENSSATLNQADLSDPFAEDNFLTANVNSNQATNNNLINTTSSQDSTHQGSSLTEPENHRTPRPILDDFPVVKAQETKLDGKISHSVQDKCTYTPEEVVHRFISAWNEAKFAVEYHCLSSKGQTLGIEEYCNRRQALRIQQEQKWGKVTQKQITQIDSCVIEGDHATIEITLLERTPLGTRCFSQQYNLIQENTQWKIKNITDGEPRKNPIVPPKGRRMKAGDFLGKSKSNTP